jgi:O-antigen chain-terminating methyltransferase
VIERQERFNAALVRLLNAHLDRTARLHASLRELAEALVHYAQRVEPVMDARDRMRVALAPTRADLILEAFDRRLEAMGQRLDGLVALRDRMEVVSEEVRALRASLRTAAPAPEVARSVAGAAADSVYTAFENRFRGSREEIRARQADYVTLFRDLAPVVDLGCGRGEFLELLRGAGVQARGVESNANVVRECRERGLDVVQGDLLDHLREEEPGSLGGVFAAQVVEHLPPPVLSALLREAHRVLRPDGLLVLETVNPASALAFLDVFIRDLTHERPLHPETLRFLAAAAGFSEVRIEMRSPVPADVRLHLLPSSGLPPPVIKALNENVERLNALLFAPLDYALLARR